MTIGEISISLNSEDVDFEWKIEGFTSLSERDGVNYRSPDFSFGGEKWWLVIWPNGCSERNSSGRVDLRLSKHYSRSSIRQGFYLSIKTLKGEKEYEEGYTKVFEKGWDSHDFIWFIPRSELLRRRSELMPHDVLTVVCTMKNMTFAGSDTGRKHKESSKIKSVDASTETEKEDAGKKHKESSKNRSVDASTQTEEEDGKEHKESSKNKSVDASTQIEGEGGKEHKESSKNTGIDTSTQTEEEDDLSSVKRSLFWQSKM